jgi:hypothetical protein
MAAKRVQELQVEYLDGEALVYNPHRSEATALNDVAAAVFNVCDGEHDIDAMIAHLDSVGLGPSSADIVGLALRDLAAADLIEVDADLPDTASRRDMLKKLVGAAAGATVLLPIVETIAAPAAAAAASYPTPAPFASPTPAPFVVIESK